MKKALPVIIVALLFLVGVGVLGYPLISAMINNAAVRRGADTYREQVQTAENAEIEARFAEAQKYNDSLHRTILADPFDEKSYGLIGENYLDTFTENDGLIGYVEIPKINVYLPIYHGISIDVLSKGCGHLENTSLPIGGESTHSVISAHSAFPGETFFDYLPELKEGDVFYIHVLDRDLEYMVDKITVVLPDDTSELYIRDGEDYVTLLTCTPYSVNTHRLLVRGKRVTYDPSAEHPVQNVQFGEGYLYLLGYKLSYPVMALMIGGFLLFVALGVFAVLGIRRLNTKRKGGGHD